MKYVLLLALIPLLWACQTTTTETEEVETETELETTESDWTPLFDGETLDGWRQVGGEAKYEVENGEIVGTTVLDTPNSFLVTTDEYGDFELELEFLVDTSLNSGVMIRAHTYPADTLFMLTNSSGDTYERKQEKGRVYGYQVEIDPSARAWSGGIYDEARRGWIYNLENEPDARAAFKRDDWNKYRIVAKGDSINTFINGVPAARLQDDADSAGFIGLQVHSTDREEPMQVRWRNLRIREI
ncbi:MAG: DUF1080 domain-containing protein [Catalinimonas sp.]